MLAQSGYYLQTTAAAGNTITVTGIGFTPKFGIFSAAGNIGYDDTGWGLHNMTYGIVADTAQQATVSAWAGRAGTKGSVDSTSYVLLTIGSTGQNPSGASYIQSWDTDGFTMYIANIYTHQHNVGYLVCGGTQVSNVGIINYAWTSSGTGISRSGFGFDPNFVFGVGWGATGAGINFGMGADTDEQSGAGIWLSALGDTYPNVRQHLWVNGTEYPKIIALPSQNNGMSASVDSWETDGYDETVDATTSWNEMHVLGVEFQDDNSIPFYGEIATSTDVGPHSVPMPYRPAALMFMHGLSGNAHHPGQVSMGLSFASDTSSLAYTYTYGWSGSMGDQPLWGGLTAGAVAQRAIASSCWVYLDEFNNTDFVWSQDREASTCTIWYLGFPAPYITSPIGELTFEHTHFLAPLLATRLLTGIINFGGKIARHFDMGWANALAGVITFDRDFIGWPMFIVAQITAWLTPKASVKYDPAPSVDDLEVK